MKAFLLYKDHDFDLQQKPLPNEQALIQDLELDTLFNAMAHGDNFLFEVAKKAVLSSLEDLDSIIYRQDILRGERTPVRLALRSCRGRLFCTRS